MNKVQVVRLAVSVTICCVVMVSGYFAGRAHPPTFLTYSILWLIAFGLPAQRVYSVADVRRRWKRWLVYFLVATFGWDMVTSLMGRRHFLSEWWLVYPSGPLVLFLILMLHGWLTSTTIRFLADRYGRSSAAAER
ncbi:MAG: hypothetical protein HY314_15540 [Acidobacteria bacterium]|nr:hypothetical protein [Acidobacteriota bacterium]